MRLMHQAHARELAALDAQFRSGAYQKQYAAAVAQKSQLEEQLAALTPLLEQYAAVDAAHAATQVVQVSPRVSVAREGPSRVLGRLHLIQRLAAVKCRQDPMQASQHNTTPNRPSCTPVT